MHHQGTGTGKQSLLFTWKSSMQLQAQGRAGGGGAELNAPVRETLRNTSNRAWEDTSAVGRAGHDLGKGWSG